MDFIKFSKEILNSGIEISLGYIIFEGITVKKEHTQFLDDYISEVKSSIHEKYTLENIKNQDIVRKFRDFYWKHLKIDPTKIRPSAEALIRRILGGKDVWQISDVVDAYNWVSIETLIPMGAYDYDVLEFPLIFRYAKEGEKFVPIDGKVRIMKGIEMVLVDTSNKIMFQYPYRDADFSKVTLKTKNLLLVSCGVPGISTELLEKSIKKFHYIFEKTSVSQFSASNIEITKGD